MTPKVVKYSSVTASYEDFHRKMIVKETDLMKKMGITPNQVYLMKLLFFRDWKSMYSYFSKVNGEGINSKKLTAKEVNDLYDKGLLDSRWIPHLDAFPDQVEFTKEGSRVFCDALGMKPSIYENIVKERFDLESAKREFEKKYAEQYYAAYPENVQSGNQLLVLKACNPIEYKGKTYQYKDGLLQLYSEIIDYSRDTHNKVMDALKRDASVGFRVCRVSIMRFTANRGWETIKGTGSDGSNSVNL